MTARLAHIRRHPIKSIGGEALDRVTLAAARRLPGDREWAVLTDSGDRHAGGPAEPDHWLPKSCFVRGVKAATLQAVKGGWDGAGLHLSHPDRPDLVFDPERDPAALIDWVAPLWPADQPAPSRLVRGAAIWTDVRWPWLSVLSLASLAALEARLNQRLGIDRWRGNLWLGGLEPFAERDLIGRIITIGPVELRVTEPIGRCAATSANTETGRIDGDMPAALDRMFGHGEFGLYAEVVTGGEIAVGDGVGL